jgi:hypothetical protein
LTWYDPDLVDATLSSRELTELINNEEINFPDVFLANAVEVQENDKEATLFEGGVVFMETMFCGFMSEFMELELFPLDIQDLSIVVRCKNQGWRLKPVESKQYRRVRETVELAEWYICQPTMRVSVAKNGRCTWKLMLKVMRKSDYYLYNVLAVVWAITSICFFAFLFKINEWEGRGNLITTLLLTAVTFKFVVAQSLPKVPFFTLLDVYLFTAVFIMVALMFWSAGVCFLNLLEIFPENVLEMIDAIFLWFCVVLWTYGNIHYGRTFINVAKHQRQQVGRLVEEVSTNFEGEGQRPGALARLMHTPAPADD